MVTMAIPSWVQVATVVPACAPMDPAADASSPTAATSTITATSWCVCAALATKVQTHRFVFEQAVFRSFISTCLHLTHTHHRIKNQNTSVPL